jgi:hypothetical protein
MTAAATVSRYDLRKAHDMATNSELLTVMIKDTTFHWPRIDQPYRYDAQNKKTDACAASAPNAGYSISFDMPMDKAKELHATLKAHYNATKATKPKLPPFKTVFGMKKDEAAGTVRFTAKKRAISNSGKLNKPPVVVGGDKLPLVDPAIWSGSKGNLRVLAFATQDPDGEGGISLLLDTVQVIEAVYGGDGLDDFDEVKTSKPITADDDFDAPKAAPPKAQEMKREIDDEF